MINSSVVCVGYARAIFVPSNSGIITFTRHPFDGLDGLETGVLGADVTDFGGSGGFAGDSVEGDEFDALSDVFSSLSEGFASAFVGFDSFSKGFASLSGALCSSC